VPKNGNKLSNNIPSQMRANVLRHVADKEARAVVTSFLSQTL